MAMNRLIRDDARNVAIRLKGRGNGYYAAYGCEPHANRNDSQGRMQCSNGWRRPLTSLARAFWQQRVRSRHTHMLQSITISC